MSKKAQEKRRKRRAQVVDRLQRSADATESSLRADAREILVDVQRGAIAIPKLPADQKHIVGVAQRMKGKQRAEEKRLKQRKQAKASRKAR